VVYSFSALQEAIKADSLAMSQDLQWQIDKSRCLAEHACLDLKQA